MFTGQGLAVIALSLPYPYASWQLYPSDKAALYCISFPTPQKKSATAVLVGRCCWLGVEHGSAMVAPQPGPPRNTKPICSHYPPS